MIKQYLKFRRDLKKIRRLFISQKRAARLKFKELGILGMLKLGHGFIHKQIQIRPRVRLFAKFIVILTLLFAVISPASRYLEQKKADIVIGGHRILVAAPADTKPVEQIDIDQTVSAHKSPFEFNRPVEGYISQGFSAYHRANDIAAPYGSPIHSVGEGTVIFAGMVYDGHGNMVIIDHGNGLKSTYAHMSKIYVGVGNHVDGTTVIGAIGLTGHTTGPHVHLEIIDNGTFVDPSGILPQ